MAESYTFLKPETKFHVTSMTCLHRSAAGHLEHSWNEPNQACGLKQRNDTNVKNTENVSSYAKLDVHRHQENEFHSATLVTFLCCRVPVF